MTMTGSAPALQWWHTTWGALRPGDDILAPDGNAWTVGPAVVSDGAGEWLITHAGRSAWTPHAEGESIQARRYPVADDASRDARVVTLMGAFGSLEEVAAVEPERPGAGRWLLCGRRECTCNQRRW